MELELTEHRSIVVELTPTMRTELREAADGRLSFALTDRAEEVEIKASSWVGTLVTAHTSVLVRPKISLSNLFYLLGSGRTALPLEDRDFEYDESRDLLPVLAALFARQVEIATRRGLFHTYRPYEERLVALRGRIDLTQQLKTPGMISPAACRFDELTTDVGENRVLKAALRRAARLSGVREDDRRLIAGLLFAFDDVTDTAESHESVDRVVFNQLNRHYEPPLRLAQLLLRWSSVVDRAGTRAASSFMVDMNVVYEEFLEHRLRRELSGRLQVLGQHKDWLDEEHRVRIKPDLVFRDAGRTAYVADAKYKLNPTGLARQADYYQLHSYCTALGLREGMLVYCHDDDDHPDRTVTARGTDVALVTYRLALGGDRADIDRSISRLADTLVERVSSRQPGLVSS